MIENKNKKAETLESLVDDSPNAQKPDLNDPDLSKMERKQILMRNKKFDKEIQLFGEDFENEIYDSKPKSMEEIEEGAYMMADNIMPPSGDNINTVYDEKTGKRLRGTRKKEMEMKKEKWRNKQKKREDKFWTHVNAL